MRLFGTKTSPFVRKVRVVASELGLDGRIAFEEVNLALPSHDLTRANPTRRVPTLIADDGTVLFDSPVIMEWLDTEYGGNRLLPAGGAARWSVLRTQALADGVLDSATSIRHETQRPDAEQSTVWIEKHLTKITSALARFDGDDTWRSANEPDVGTIAEPVRWDISAYGFQICQMPSDIRFWSPGSKSLGGGHR